ncbi:isochorismatase family cysteine hydrolase [Phocaeicola paurosaccharolyticus]|jgi:nicotinamidase-related amidase|uniref:cysteine hydrolase family protein n=1 Tax=Phocaeicola paurosaccharolyticus TaxID=732242 RepID=UPI002FE226E2
MEKALVVIDLQNDITKNYREIIDNVNAAINWAVNNNIDVIFIRHENITPGTRTFKHDTRGSEFVPEMKIVTENIFTKTKANALTSEEFVNYIKANGIKEFYIAGADATECVKSTCYNMSKSNYKVNVLSDCITSYNKNKIADMIKYYESKGANIITLDNLL